MRVFAFSAENDAEGAFMAPGRGESTIDLDHDANEWVKLEDAKAFALAEYERGKFDNQKAVNYDDPYGHGFANGVAIGEARRSAIPLADQSNATRTNQLLNELYHDRARLERAVKDAVTLAKSVIANIPEVDDTELAGHLLQFVDTHGGD